MCLSVMSANADEVLTPDERIIALTILGEARGEGNIGMYAVACVIQKRASQRNLTPAKVCLQPSQFSIWNGVKRESQLWYLWDSRSAGYARQLARLVMKVRLNQCVTGGADHYCTLKVSPKWAKGKTPVKVIGNHKFFKLNLKVPSLREENLKSYEQKKLKKSEIRY